MLCKYSKLRTNFGQFVIFSRKYLDNSSKPAIFALSKLIKTIEGI